MSRRIYRSQIDRANLIADRLARPSEPVRDAIPVDDSRARITKAPPFVDARFAPSAGHIGEFSRAGIGRYVAPEDDIETEGMGL
jgi:hypothetical protein